LRYGYWNLFISLAPQLLSFFVELSYSSTASSSPVQTSRILVLTTQATFRSSTLVLSSVIAVCRILLIRVIVFSVIVWLSIWVQPFSRRLFLRLGILAIQVRGPALVISDESELALGDFEFGGEGDALHAFVELDGEFPADLLIGSKRGTVVNGQLLVCWLDFWLKLTEDFVVDHHSELGRQFEEAFPRSVVGRLCVQGGYSGRHDRLMVGTACVVIESLLAVEDVLVFDELTFVEESLVFKELMIVEELVIEEEGTGGRRVTKTKWTIRSEQQQLKCGVT
jgi:hypothetical protein